MTTGSVVIENLDILFGSWRDLARVCEHFFPADAYEHHDRPCAVVGPIESLARNACLITEPRFGETGPQKFRTKPLRIAEPLLGIGLQRSGAVLEGRYAKNLPDRRTRVRRRVACMPRRASRQKARQSRARAEYCHASSTGSRAACSAASADRKSTRLNSSHTDI